MMNEEEKIRILEDLVGQYVTYLKVWGKVKVERVIREEAPVVEMVKMENRYGEVEEELVSRIVKTVPSPYIRVTYYDCKEPYRSFFEPGAFESKEFPLCHIDKQIAKYRNKLKRMLKEEKS